MEDALTEEGDEGRGLAAISVGEMPNNLRSDDFRMGKPPRANHEDVLRTECLIMNFEFQLDS